MKVKDLGAIKSQPSGRILLMAILNSARSITGFCDGLSTESLQNFEAEVNNKRKFSILSVCKIFS